MIAAAAGAADHRTTPFLAERSRGRSIHIGHRHQDKQHHAHLVHLAAPDLGRIGVPELVQRLHAWIDGNQEQQVARAEGLVRHIADQRRPVDGGEREPGQYQREPGDESQGREQRSRQRQGRGQEAIGINQRQP